ncbi:MAG: bifunctional riboflavin kinase/FAD synthetase [Bacillota bacterium]
MDILTDYNGLGHLYNNICVGLGNFDGVHLGHQRLINRLVSHARGNAGTSVVFTFEPHPAMVLNPEAAPPLLLAPEHKQRLIGGLGIDVLLAVRFTKEFAQLTPEAFIQDVLCAELDARAVFVGYNYTFGHRGAGNPETLRTFAKKCAYRLEVIPPVMLDGQPVSSTLIRNLLNEGKVDEARRYLGYYPMYKGKVVAGESRGSTIGFPTANLEVEERILVPANGVYAVKLLIDGERFLGVANIGVCPTFTGGAPRKRRVEVFVFDFHGDLYEKELEVLFTRRLREERRFGSAAELVEQIRLDVAAARALAE